MGRPNDCLVRETRGQQGGNTAMKFLSRKFLLALGAITADILIGLGYNVDPEMIAIIAGAIATIYMAIEGAVDISNKGAKKP